MKPQSAKAKGRKLQQDIVKFILGVFPFLTPRDVQSTSMGAGGVDVKLSTEAFKCFPYKVECKWRKTFGSIYKAYEQHSPTEPGEPVLFIKDNHKRPLAIISAEHFFALLSPQRKGNNDKPDDGGSS